MDTRFAWLQPLLAWAEFHELGLSPPPCLSWCPTRALPEPLRAQLLQVLSPVRALPSALEPVSMSCVFGLSPRPLTVAPFSVSEFSFPNLLLGAVQVVHALSHDNAFCVLPRS